MKIKYFLAIFLMAGLLFSCQKKQEEPVAEEVQAEEKQESKRQKALARELEWVRQGAKGD